MTPGSADPLARHIAEVRRFNRFYTARFGLLRRRHLGGDFSLTESRLLYEIGAHSAITAATLCAILELDAGYLSRLLAALTRRRLVRQVASRKDARRKHLTLTPAGRNAVALINRQSDEQLQQMLAHAGELNRQILVDSLQQVRAILGERQPPRPKPKVRIERLRRLTPEAKALLKEYYETVHVVQRDTPEGVRKLFRERGAGMWLARIGKQPVGCVVLRQLDSTPRASECKRLCVKPSARGNGIGDRLLDAMEKSARRQRIDWIYLDSYDDLKTAIALYERRGYQRCPRFNENPQATLYMRKRLAD